MTRNELITELEKLGFKRTCCDNSKTLEAYNQISCILKDNKTPLKAISKVYVENDELRFVAYGEDLTSNYFLSYERLKRVSRYIVYHRGKKQYYAMNVCGVPLFTDDMKVIDDKHIFKDVPSVYECIQNELEQASYDTHQLMIQSVWLYLD